ncbi:hypothetical protein GI584_22020 [Gracilibacillus salitolerans]|uniref:Uncharacterized protein n=1 Tax=Gracilibacillus salitolerans TaxID=2663022 RepID=A0A5Q2TNM9_9BACI|nr:hypothetical protein [Gracilibacillus salitolerans]QGH36564.1 hypothetical protein GI584_22020 [Gracilibacillus salitolerans]
MPTESEVFCRSGMPVLSRAEWKKANPHDSYFAVYVYRAWIICKGT